MLMAFTLVAVIVLGGFAYKHYSGCSGNCEKGSYDTKMSWVCEMSCAAKNYDKSKIVVNSVAKQGDLTKCPISGVVFTVSEQTGTIKYGNNIYHTCCGTCAKMFSDEPSKYASNLN